MNSTLQCEDYNQKKKRNLILPSVFAYISDKLVYQVVYTVNLKSGFDSFLATSPYSWMYSLISEVSNACRTARLIQTAEVGNCPTGEHMILPASKSSSIPKSSSFVTYSNM